MRSVFLTLIALAMFAGGSLAQTSANFDLSENVIAGGGGTSSGPTFTLTGSIGQPVAGRTSFSANFRLTGGFESVPPLAPTAASVSISGRVQTAMGAAIRGAVVTLIDASTGRQQMVTTGTFGHFRLTGVAAGGTYVVSIIHRRYQFADATRMIEVTDNISDVVFTSVSP